MPSFDVRSDHRPGLQHAPQRTTQQGQHHTQALSPRLQHAVRLLQMSSMDFAANVREVLGKNPFLEAEDGDGAELDHTDRGDGDGGGAGDGIEAATSPSSRDDGELAYDSDTFDTPSSVDFDGRGDGFDTGEHTGLAPAERPDDALLKPTDNLQDNLQNGDQHGEPDSDRDVWQADVGSAARQGGDGDLSALDRMPCVGTLTSHLHGQLNLLPLARRELLLARTLVESLDDDGYLRTPLPELLDVTEVEPKASVGELETALAHVQSLDPAGVAARSVAECLQLQLPDIECAQMREVAARIVADHLDALAAHDLPGLARQLRLPLKEVQAACDRLRHLDPRPGWRFSATRVAYVVPDVVVKKVRSKWVVQLNPAVVPRVRLNQVYAELFKRHRTAEHADLAGHLQEARWTVRNVQQRFATIVEVTEAIVKRQQHFLDFGPMAMKPLGLREIAEEVGVHESTVSRVTNNKYIATPSGVFELKHFFSRAMVTANGSECSGTAIRGLLKDMIDAEPADAPLSDPEITRQLAQQGLVVARRTVTKYRQLLKIDTVGKRRRSAATAPAAVAR